MYDRKRIQRPRSHMPDPAESVFPAAHAAHDPRAMAAPSGATSAGHSFGQVAVSPPASPAPDTLVETHPLARPFAISIARQPASSGQQETAPDGSGAWAYARSADAGGGGGGQEIDLAAQTSKPPSTDLDVAPPEPECRERV